MSMFHSNALPWDVSSWDQVKYMSFIQVNIHVLKANTRDIVWVYNNPTSIMAWVEHIMHDICYHHHLRSFHFWLVLIFSGY